MSMDQADRRVSFPSDQLDPPAHPSQIDMPSASADPDPITASPPSTLSGHDASRPAQIPPTVEEETLAGPRKRPNRQVTVDTTAGRTTPSASRRQTSESARSRRQSTDPNIGVLRRMTTGLLTEKKIGKAPTYASSFKAAIMSSWLNILLVFIPISWALHFVKEGGNDKISDTAVFITSFIAIIPLAGLLGFATEEAALRLGQTLGGLLNATLGNVVELIVAILALIKCELAVVQSSLVGSILSNLLLVLGMCFFAGGVRFSEQVIKGTAAQLNASLLLIAVIAVLIPSAFHFSVNTTDDGSNATLSDAAEGKDLLAMSHGVAVLLLILYLGYLLFQMWTHASLYTDEHSESTSYAPEVMGVREKFRMPERIRSRLHRRKKTDEEDGTGSSTTTAVASNGTSAELTTPVAENGTATANSQEEEEEEVPQMNMVVTVIVMALDAVLVGVTAEWLVASINGLVESHPSLSAEWVGLILLPIVGNAAEHFTAVSVSVKDKIDLSISVAVGSSIQIALFVIPVIELLAWCIGKPMTLLFDPYESIVLFLSVIIVNQTLADGRSNWMEGLVLMLLYLIIAVSFWYYPGSNTATLLGC